MAEKRTEVDVDGRTLSLSNLDKVFYPEASFTKAHVIDYYTRIAPWLLPHLKDRPLTLKRYPNGVEGEFFYQKQCPPHRPDWVRTKTVWSEGGKRDIHFCVIDDLATLVWAANLADLELHTFLSTTTDVAAPTIMAFDLDPGAPADILDCAEVALWLRDILEGVGLAAYPKTSGSKGMQVYVPVNTGATYAQTKNFSRALAELLERHHKTRVTANMRKDLRRGKVFVDWSQNDEHKTTVSVYSLRAKSRPTVSTPLAWEEVEEAFHEKDRALLTFEAEDVLDRVDAFGDLFEPVLTRKQKLPAFDGLLPSK